MKVQIKSMKEAKSLKEWFSEKDFNKMSPEEQEQYLKDHPNSKFQKVTVSDKQDDNLSKVNNELSTNNSNIKDKIKKVKSNNSNNTDINKIFDDKILKQVPEFNDNDRKTLHYMYEFDKIANRIAHIDYFDVLELEKQGFTSDEISNLKKDASTLSDLESEYVNAFFKWHNYLHSGEDFVHLPSGEYTFKKNNSKEQPNKDKIKELEDYATEKREKFRNEAIKFSKLFEN